MPVDELNPSLPDYIEGEYVLGDDLIEDDEVNFYPQAGETAQPEIQAAIARFRELPEAERAEIPLLWWLLGDGSQPYKMSKPDSNYVDHSRSRQQCQGCLHAYYRVADEAFICSVIRGIIEPKGWCRLWEPME